MRVWFFFIHPGLAFQNTAWTFDSSRSACTVELPASGLLNNWSADKERWNTSFSGLFPDLLWILVPWRLRVKSQDLPLVMFFPPFPRRNLSFPFGMSPIFYRGRGHVTLWGSLAKWAERHRQPPRRRRHGSPEHRSHWEPFFSQHAPTETA